MAEKKNKYLGFLLQNGVRAEKLAALFYDNVSNEKFNQSKFTFILSF